MAKAPFESPVARRVGNPVISQICACDCGTVSGAGGGSGIEAPLSTQAVAAKPAAKRRPATKTKTPAKPKT